MHYNRQPLIGDRDPWTHLFINVEREGIDISKPHPLVNIAGTTILHQHEITFITGATHCRAHAVAKMLAAAVICGEYQFAQSIQVAKPDTTDNDASTATNNRVLWIDTVHSFYTACGIINDLKQNMSISDDNLRFMCLDALGTFNERYECVLNSIIQAIYDYKPALVIIDDMDHLAPDCGYNLTENFYLMIKDVLDHTSTTILCIGYNLIGRAKSTAGPIGKRLFGISNNIFRITSRGSINLIQRIKGITCDGQTEFAFNINDKNFPQEIIMTPDDTSCDSSIFEAAAVQEVFSTMISKNENISHQQLIKRLSKHRDSIKQAKRHQRLIASAITSGILCRTTDGNYRLNSSTAASDATPPVDYLDYYINKSLITNKIPNLPNHPAPNPLTFIKTPAPPIITD